MFKAAGIDYAETANTYACFGMAGGRMDSARAEFAARAWPFAGVKVYEYTERPLHGKVAAVDDEWATVGSSNLDPLSLSLNLEANVMILDRAFNRHLGEKLEGLMRNSCRLIEESELPHSNTWLMVRSFFVFHFLRHFP